MLIVKALYKKGLGLFGAKTDSDVFASSSVSEGVPSLQYNSVKLYVYFSGQLGIPLLTKDKNAQIRSILPLTFSLTFDSRYSFDSLYGRDCFSAIQAFMINNIIRQKAAFRAAAYL
jgi:hypothetical protein